MLIRELIWPQERIDHVARHGVTPTEVEEVCFGEPLVLRAKKRGSNPVYHMLGQTFAGRYILAIVIQFPDGNGFPITARPMTESERRRYQRWKQR